MVSETPDVLWAPDPDTAATTALAEFTGWVRQHRGVDAPDYAALHRWSVDDLEGFWSAAAEFLGMRFHDQPTAVLGSSEMPGAQWFPGATLNYAEHVLTPGPGRQDTDVAVVFAREDGLRRTVTHAELRDLVGRARAGLVALGVGCGDRVVALAPNCVETLVTFLAAASLGAVWSSCSPDFGARAVHDRFAQIEPVVLLAVDGYVYGGKRYDIRPTLEALRAQLPTVRATVLVPYLDPAAELGGPPSESPLPEGPLPEGPPSEGPLLEGSLLEGPLLEGTLPWLEFTAVAAEPAFEPVPFDHPLWVLYSSGTTGLPKGIVHGHGGIVLEHLKSLRLQMDLGPGERFFWFTTTGWMMWNLLIGGLLVGATVVLFDGNPGHPDLATLWRLADEHDVTYFGVSAPFVQSCLKAGLKPGAECDLSSLRALGSTGAPLSVEGFRWIGEAVSADVQICSVSGGTDLCAAFVGAAPNVPVWLGEISCAQLGAAVVAYDDNGEEVVDEVGELVLTKPMPSMPVSFWNDPDGARLRAAYFEDFPGRWRHGDWVRRTPRSSYVIYGRSDSTLNRGGVRMGTADFYAVVEAFDEVADSLVVDTSELGAAAEGALLCFLVLAPGSSLADVEPGLRHALRSELSPRHVPDRFILVEAIPRTLNGKKCEVPVKKILAGVAPDKAVSRGALQDPDSLRPFLDLASADR